MAVLVKGALGSFPEGLPEDGDGPEKHIAARRSVEHEDIELITVDIQMTRHRVADLALARVAPEVQNSLLEIVALTVYTYVNHRIVSPVQAAPLLPAYLAKDIV